MSNTSPTARQELLQVIDMYDDSLRMLHVLPLLLRSETLTQNLDSRDTEALLCVSEMIVERFTHIRQKLNNCNESLKRNKE